jgi:hypothetical protein
MAHSRALRIIALPSALRMACRVGGHSWITERIRIAGALLGDDSDGQQAEQQQHEGSTHLCSEDEVRG